MDKHPCNDLHAQYLKALDEWMAASAAVQSFVSTQPLQPGQNPPMIDFHSYKAASEREAQAHSRYVDTMNAYMDCAKLHGPSTA